MKAYSCHVRASGIEPLKKALLKWSFGDAEYSAQVNMGM